MDKADQIINAEREKSKAKLVSAKASLQPFGAALLVLLFGTGMWLAFDMFSLINDEGHIILLATLVLGLLAIFALLRLLPKTRLTAVIVRAAGI